MTDLTITPTGSRANLQQVRRDPIMVALRNKTPAEIVQYLQNASPAEREAAYMRAVVIAAWLLQKE